ncbi:hypothetical protein J6590_101486 [Homalodisca vitripennis]|nr:hypothetical protein J6590_101486 [Homalodisca vitripennis]
MLTEPNGIVLKFTVYAGAKDELSGPGQTEKAAIHLLSERFDRRYSVFVDNFYKSVSLPKSILEKTYITGTERADRVNLPADVVKKSLKRGETVAKYYNGVVVAPFALVIHRYYAEQLRKQFTIDVRCDFTLNLSWLRTAINASNTGPKWLQLLSLQRSQFKFTPTELSSSDELKQTPLVILHSTTSPAPLWLIVIVLD